jgi:ABC-type lipoprotein release transport system permease subunit
MLTVLAFRNLVVKKGRSLLLLLGYGLGVGVMIVLLSVGEAMVDQSRDVSLVGGGALTVLPQGIDIEAMRTGGVSGMFFSIGRARFLTRQLLGGARQSRMVRAVSPVIENKLVYLRHGDQVIAARAGGATERPTPRGSPRHRSSCITSWTVSTFRRCPTRAGRSGTTST